MQFDRSGAAIWLAALVVDIALCVVLAARVALASPTPPPPTLSPPMSIGVG